MSSRESAPESGTREQFLREVSQLDPDRYERRHETLMEWAQSDLGLNRAYAEGVYELAQEEDVEPILAFHLVRSGLGVRELEPPEQDMEEALQQRPPEWVAEETVELDDVELERTLRASLRRLRSHLESSESPVAAVDGYLGEADVGPVRLS